MELFDIVTYVTAAFVLMFMLSFLYSYWPLFLLVLGIILINKFTMWASLVIFFLCTGMNLYDPRAKGLRAEMTIYDGMLDAFKVTVGIVIAAWLIGMFFSGDSSNSGLCGRATLYGC
ncbi:hypothetical protein [uncultured Vibrio sp.]|uniref:hypothetical protein n=1 Tax=uncultured Vibrio sp. TaxID=114054 RepID=UPI0026143438|nr:hypothetical protein [uncultured Vibrio sp.]